LFEEEQYQSLSVLIEKMLAGYPIQSIAGHEHIAPGRKADPGAGFDWPRLRQCLAPHALCFPPTGANAGGANSETA
jgi:AmpD protein